MSRPYEMISARPDFREFINDMLTRMGLGEPELKILFGQQNQDRNYKEFAKCFVTRGADPQFNYEVNELAGDLCLNQAVIMYFLKILNSTQEAKRDREKAAGRDYQPDSRLVDYFNKLKAVYINKETFVDIANRFGFNDFMVYGARDAKNDPDAKFLCDSIESFIGCFELLVDRYIEPHYSHRYVLNFVAYVYNSRYINYNPSHVYEPVTLLKETNDATKPKNGDGFTYTVGPDDRDANLTVVYRTDFTTGPDGRQRTRRIVVSEIEFLNSRTNQVKFIMSQRALDYMKRHPEKINARLIKEPPTPEELGIEELCTGL